MAKPMLSNMAVKLAEAAIRKATGMKLDMEALGSESVRDVAVAVVEAVAAALVEDDGATLHCKLCGRGPFTRKGLYLHIKRIHMEEVYEMVMEELRRHLWRLQNATQ